MLHGHFYTSTVEWLPLAHLSGGRRRFVSPLAVFARAAQAGAARG
jgi:hypothetical protein